MLLLDQQGHQVLPLLIQQVPSPSGPAQQVADDAAWLWPWFQPIYQQQ